MSLHKLLKEPGLGGITKQETYSELQKTGACGEYDHQHPDTAHRIQGLNLNPLNGSYIYLNNIYIQ